MQVQFKYPRKVGGVIYAKGIHEVPDDQAKDWFFEALVKAGDAAILASPELPAEPAKPVQKQVKPTSQSQKK